MCRYMCCNTLLMKQQFVITHQYTILQETKHLLILNRPALHYVMFFWKYKNKQCFCEHNNFIEGVFVTELSRCRISVGQIVWVMTKCHFMSDIYIVCKKCGIKVKLCRREPDQDRLTHHWCWGSDSTYCPEQGNFQFIVSMMHSQMYLAQRLVGCEKLMVHIVHRGWHWGVSMCIYSC
jgi:hypothetical protein